MSGAVENLDELLVSSHLPDGLFNLVLVQLLLGSGHHQASVLANA